MSAAGKRFYSFLTGTVPGLELPAAISILNPYRQPEVKSVLKKFCDRFYADDRPRVLILGINPGRFGAGVTGIPFTDPVQLEEKCGITNSFLKKQELSSRFIYEMIESYGGVQKFYDKFLLSAVCPFGFLNGPVNYNYYDSAELQKATHDFISSSLRKHASWNIKSTTVISLGKKNASCLEAFNRELKLFEKIITLEHPRYIMQYKVKSKQEYIERYCTVLNTV